MGYAACEIERTEQNGTAERSRARAWYGWTRARARAWVRVRVYGCTGVRVRRGRRENQRARASSRYALPTGATTPMTFVRSVLRPGPAGNTEPLDPPSPTSELSGEPPRDDDEHRCIAAPNHRTILDLPPANLRLSSFFYLFRLASLNHRSLPHTHTPLPRNERFGTCLTRRRGHCESCCEISLVERQRDSSRYPLGRGL
ncbi:hypothetical protein K0M31_017050 [Melipona bicolor]|uniref:Uncharacterized protein n=1 Tax=Melipona bicolor TaxID=60889 RepID=A0AA40FDI4_9HYME|nr:hypothetical protein K0M31_017050 [Melipona bicolor]